VRTVVAVVAALVIIGSAVWLFGYYRAQPKPGAVVPHKAPVACAACGKAYVTMLGDQPARCHYCGQQTLWRARACANPECGAIIPVVRDSSAAEAGPLRCPRCGGTRFKEVPPDGLEEH